MKTITVRLSDDEAETLAALCFVLDTTQVDLVRKGIRAVAKEAGPLPSRPRRQPSLPGVEDDPISYVPVDPQNRSAGYVRAGTHTDRSPDTFSVAPTIGSSRVAEAPEREVAEAMNRADKVSMLSEGKAMIDRMRGKR